jgi:hypothetical protein
MTPLIEYVLTLAGKLCGFVSLLVVMLIDSIFKSFCSTETEASKSALIQNDELQIEGTYYIPLIILEYNTHYHRSAHPSLLSSLLGFVSRASSSTKSVDFIYSLASLHSICKSQRRTSYTSSLYIFMPQPPPADSHSLLGVYPSTDALSYSHTPHIRAAGCRMSNTPSR